MDPSVPALYPALTAVAANAVAGLRAQVGAEVDDPRLTELVEELTAGSERFRRLWARHDVTVRAGGGLRVFRHPRVGELELRYEKFTISGTNQSLVVYHAEPGGPSARSLARLARSAAGDGSG
ncbi:hypothetical protein ACFYPX_10690 [Micromonospora zamorensis]|uniref:MmyB family transcriptional regulator n=1 Tax=Micromonospora zamorensis TaxID=709883 RepID=UPI0036C57DDD